MQELLPKTVVGIAGAVFLFGFAVFVHELGHFLTAKFFGVGVSKFAIGFGPKIWAFVWRGTEYSLRWIPVGGFVALKGMIQGIDDEEETGKPSPPPDTGETKENQPALDNGTPAAVKEKESITQDLDALRDRHPLIRIAVFAAGVTCNFLTAVFIVGLIAWIGRPVEKPWPNTLYEVPATSPLYQLGWRAGDRVVEVGGKPVNDWLEIAQELTPKAKDSQLVTTETLTVERNGRRLALSLPSQVPFSSLLDQGFDPPRPALVGAAQPGMAAASARLVKDNYVQGEEIRPMPTWEEMPKKPLRGGDRIVEVENVPIAFWQDMNKQIRSRPGRAVFLTIERGSNDRKRLMRLMAVIETTEDKPPVGRLGIMAGPELTGERDHESFFKAFGLAPKRTFDMAVLVIKSQVDFIRKATWKETKRSLGGPLMIGKMAYQSAQRGWDEYLSLFMIISLVLAIMNLLPIPVLDGGYIFITLVEVVIRRPVPERILIPILTSFMVLIITAMGYLFLNDILNW